MGASVTHFVRDGRAFRRSAHRSIRFANRRLQSLARYFSKTVFIISPMVLTFWAPSSFSGAAICKAQFSKNHIALRKRNIRSCRVECCCQSRVYCAFRELYASRDIHIQILVRKFELRLFFKDGCDSRNPVRVDFF